MRGGGLAMILAYHGRWIPLEQLRVACGVSRDGTKATNILKAARRYGLVAKGFRKDPETLHELPMPAIIHWNFNHFVVLEGMHRGRAYINDPAMGRRAVDMDEFDGAFTGVVLAMEPDAEFRKSGRKPAAFRILGRELPAARPAVLLLLLVSLALAISGIVIPAFSKIFVDEILVEGLEGWFRPLLIGMAVTAARAGRRDRPAAVAAAASGEQNRRLDGQSFSVARAVAAGRVFHPTPSRRHREPGRRQRADRAPAFRRPGHQRAQSDHARFLCGGDDGL